MYVNYINRSAFHAPFRLERTKPPKPMIDLSKYGKVKMLNEKFDRVANRVRSFVLDPLADSPALLPEEQALLRSAVRLDPLGV